MFPKILQLNKRILADLTKIQYYLKFIYKKMGILWSLLGFEIILTNDDDNSESTNVSSELKQKARGCILGSIIGDAKQAYKHFLDK